MIENTLLKSSAGKPGRRCVLVFVKAPVHGTVKTRLARRLGPETAMQLYTCFTADVLAALDRVGVPVVVCHHPPESGNRIEQWLGSGYAYRPQQGKDLGQRMRHAFDQVFAAGQGQAVLIGTDVPDLPEAFVDQAFAALDHTGAVLGPAADGGYYLVGFRCDTFLPDIFENIPWSTGAVCRRTLDIFRRKNRAVHQLPLWRDIDEYRDLEQFIARYRNRRSPARHTLNYLRSAGMMDRTHLPD